MLRESVRVSTNGAEAELDFCEEVSALTIHSLSAPEIHGDNYNNSITPTEEEQPMMDDELHQYNHEGVDAMLDRDAGEEVLLLDSLLEGHESGAPQIMGMTKLEVCSRSFRLIVQEAAEE